MQKCGLRGQGAEAASYAAACTREVSACIRRYKGGSKVSLGVYKGAGGGQQYPVSDCKYAEVTALDQFPA
jgi:hypothetical protein